MRRTWTSVLCFVVAAALVAAAGPAAAFAQGSGPQVIRRPQPAAEQSFLLEPAIVPPAGATAVYVLVNVAAVGMLEATGAYAGMGMDMDETFALWVRYTMQSPNPVTGAPIVLAEAMLLDPETGTAQWDDPLEVTYTLADGRAQQMFSNKSPSAYGFYQSLITPEWLASWTYTPAGELPRRAVTPGFQWQGSPDRLLLAGFTADLDTVEPLTGRFIGWEDVPGAGVRAAHFIERSTGTRSERQAVLGEVYADVEFGTIVESEIWLIPGDFPAMVVVSAQALTETVIAETEEPLSRELAGTMAQWNGFERTWTRVYGDVDMPRRAASGQGAAPPASIDELPLLEPGDVATGYLGQGSVYESGRYIDMAAVQGSAGQTVVIRARSQDFDTRLFVFDEDGGLLAEDDDSAEGTDSRVVLTLPYTGRYGVFVTSSLRDETGEYELRVVELPDLPVIRPGEVVTGVFTPESPVDDDGVYYDLYLLEGTEGETVAVHVEPGGFDAYYLRIGNDGWQVVWEAAGEGAAASFDFTFDYSGLYVLQVSPLDPIEEGSYRLAVRRSVSLLQGDAPGDAGPAPAAQPGTAPAGTAAPQDFPGGFTDEPAARTPRPADPQPGGTSGAPGGRPAGGAGSQAAGAATGSNRALQLIDRLQQDPRQLTDWELLEVESLLYELLRTAQEEQLNRLSPAP